MIPHRACWVAGLCAHVNTMMKALIVGALCLAALFAIAPAADAHPLPAMGGSNSNTPCSYSIGLTGGYVACCDYNLWVDYGSVTYIC